MDQLDDANCTRAMKEEDTGVTAQVHRQMVIGMCGAVVGLF